MTQPIDYRQTAVDHAEAALKLIVAGDDYLTEAEVTQDMPQVFTSNKPVTIGVYAGDQIDDPAMHETHDTIDIVIQCVIRADAHVFRGLKVNQVINMVIADVKKAMEVDRTRGISAVFKGRTITTSFDFEDNFGVFTDVERYEHRRPCT